MPLDLFMYRYNISLTQIWIARQVTGTFARLLKLLLGVYGPNLHTFLYCHTMRDLLFQVKYIYLHLSISSLLSDSLILTSICTAGKKNCLRLSVNKVHSSVSKCIYIYISNWLKNNNGRMALLLYRIQNYKLCLNFL